jgi:hypothetical protein
MGEPTTEEADDTSLRWEVRWYVSQLPPAEEIVKRVRVALNRMSDTARAQERARITELAPEWAKALEATDAAQ